MSTFVYRDASDDDARTLQELAARALKLDLGAVNRSGTTANMAGLQTDRYQFSQRTDSRTIFFQDTEFRAHDGAGVFEGPDDELIGRREATTGKQTQAVLDVRGKRRGTDVEAQLDGGGHLVDVLASRPRRTNESLLDQGRSPTVSLIAALALVESVRTVLGLIERIRPASSEL